MRSGRSERSSAAYVSSKPCVHSASASNSGGSARQRPAPQNVVTACAERADHARADRCVGRVQQPARLREPAPEIRMKPARRAALELIERHHRVLRARRASGERVFRGSRRSAPGSGSTNAGRSASVRGAVIVDQHVEIDDAVRVVVRRGGTSRRKGRPARAIRIAGAGLSPSATTESGAGSARLAAIASSSGEFIAASRTPRCRRRSSASGVPGVGEKISPSTKNGCRARCRVDARCGFRSRSPA